MKHCLSIAGSDSSGGAGIQADLKTFSALGTFGMSVITAVTAQNTQGVFAVADIDESTIERQIEAVFDDICVDALKIGMVSRAQTIKIIAQTLKKYPLPFMVVDPVMISKSGFNLLNDDAKKALIELLIPMATIITPNIFEAQAILACKIVTLADMKKAAKELHTLGCANVLLKGGQYIEDATDIFYDGKAFHLLKGELIQTHNTHGTGCTLSSAIAANLAKGMELLDAVHAAKIYITQAIKQGFSLGQGKVGPVHHFYDLYQKAGVKL
ncbi:MAG: bifunctional hydroxymethylpyrimidine kinase/phosphomethylpyrimidine kinase [Sulfurospirillum sp.]|nr:bifunctional hydroxymethylpyrimidine kinase/phosphomethylpyrimidine kinase [Sulfurospirillum sp.]